MTFAFQQIQIDTMIILGIITGCSILYCFIVGEITNNNSQMDKLWSILPEVYAWVVAVKGNMNPRLVIMAVLATIWGARLTYNFAKKGAYSIKFWSGEEDYRWVILRENKLFKPHWKWALFNFFFISIYQNVLILLTTLPAVVAMTSTQGLNFIDIIAFVVMAGAIILETIADKQQWDFQSTKYKLLGEGKKLEELPHPYNKGFNTTGLWNYSRHPNYLGEQCTWVGFYVFSIAAGAGICNWSAIGFVLLILLFIGSSIFAENVTSSKYPEYKDYKKKVNRYFLLRRYNK
ncbi:MAG: DUF1295 domain-containing protein [Treponema sp.]|nr:DUF1295 domain-containing protein [Treponema sp.]